MPLDAKFDENNTKISCYVRKWLYLQAKWEHGDAEEPIVYLSTLGKVDKWTLNVTDKTVDYRVASTTQHGAKGDCREAAIKR